MTRRDASGAVVKATVFCAAVLVAMVAMVAMAVTGAEAQVEPVPEPAVRPERLIGEPEGPPLSGAELDTRTEELSSIIRCPVCQALSVNDSPSLSAIAMKEEVRDLLARGYTEDQVLRYFEQAYGEFIRLEPKARGFNLVVWLAPGLALVIGAALVVGRLRKKTPAVAATAATTVAGEDLDPYLERVRREVEG